MTGRQVGLSATVTRTMSFYRNVNPASSSVFLLPASSSPLACAVRCLSAFPNCSSYIYNSTTGHCVQAISPDLLAPQMDSGQGDLYVTCDAEKGYRLHRYGSAAACIAVVHSPRGNFTEASEHCEDMGGYLASVRTWDKLQLLTTAMGGNTTFWVGLDDIDEEGTYVWKNDGAVAFSGNANVTAAEMAEATMYGLWDHPREPNDFNGNEDCVQVKYSATLNDLRLNDFRCSTNSKFICEMQVQFL